MRIYSKVFLKPSSTSKLQLWRIPRLYKCTCLTIVAHPDYYIKSGPGICVSLIPTKIFFGKDSFWKWKRPYKYGAVLFISWNVIFPEDGSDSLFVFGKIILPSKPSICLLRHWCMLVDISLHCMQYLRSLNENKAINDYFGDQLDALKEVDFQVEYFIFSGDTGVKRFALLRYYDSSIL